VTGQPEDPELDALAAEWPGWRIWRRGDGVVCAWLLGTQPPHLLRAATAGELRKAIEEEGNDAS
jgi:hypothetical protein